MRSDPARDRVLVRLCAAAAMLLIPFLAAAQQAAPQAPFVSRLRAEAADSQIKLTWRDSPDPMGAYLVYRAAAEITAKTLDQAALVGQVNPGVQSFLDAPPDGQGYYYAVIARDASGKLYPLFIQFRNKTSTSVAALSNVAAATPSPAASSVATSPSPSESTPAVAPAAASPSPSESTSAVAPAAAASAPAQPAPPALSPPVAPLPADESVPAQITGIAAALTGTGDSVSITFRASNSRRDLLLFWAASPLAAPVDLLRSTSAVALDPGTTRYVLPALPGSTYWFAVLDAGLYKLGQAPLVKGANTTAAPVQVPASASGSLAASSTTRRVQPLPSLDLDFGIQTGSVIPDAAVDALPPEKKVSAATSQAIALLLKGVEHPRPVDRVLRILPGDESSGASGELARLQEIVAGPFRSNDMSVAESGLRDFLSLPRDAQLEAHARYYLGQAYYFQGRTRDALMEFLMSADYYYLDNKPWLDACLLKLEQDDQ